MNGHVHTVVSHRPDADFKLSWGSQLLPGRHPWKRPGARLCKGLFRNEFTPMSTLTCLPAAVLAGMYLDRCGAGCETPAVGTVGGSSMKVMDSGQSTVVICWGSGESLPISQ